MATTGTTPCPTFYLYSCAAVRIPSCSLTPIPLATLPASTASSSPPCVSNATLHVTTREPPTETSAVYTQTHPRDDTGECQARPCPVHRRGLRGLPRS